MTETRQIGRYIVESSLGEGAMGMVYKAKDPKIMRTVAIKTVKKDPSRDLDAMREFTERFLREAQISGSLFHPNIVAIFDVGEEGDMPYIAMEYVEGSTLDRYLKANDPSFEQRLNILDQLASGLDFAHTKDIVHRDLKPGNIMVTLDGAAKIMDFGIARIGGSNLTQTGMFLGTPRYSSPEQIKGGKVDSRSDLFSFAILTYEVLTHHSPFPGGDSSIHEILYKIANEPPSHAPNLRKLPIDARRWEDVFHRAFQKDPEARFQTAADLMRALHDIHMPGRKESVKDVSTTVRDVQLQQHSLQASNENATIEQTPDKVLQRSQFERRKSDERRADGRRWKDEPEQPKRRKTGLFAILFLLLLIVGGGAAYQLGYLDELISEFESTYIAEQDPADQPADPVEERSEPEAAVVDAEPQEVASVALEQQIVSNPAGAEVRINGETLGSTPVTYTWPEDQASVSLVVALDGYQTITRELARGEEPLSLDLQVAAVQRTVRATPPSAGIRIDDAEPRQGPVELSLSEGQTVTIRAEADGYYARRITYTEGRSNVEVLSITLKPVPPPGRLTVTTTMDQLRIGVDGRTYRRNTVSLQPGSYDVTLSAPNYFYEQRFENVSIASNETQTLETPVLINIPNIDIIGAYARVRIDGQFVKNGDELDTTPLIDLKIAAGTHRFEFVDEEGRVLSEKVIEVTKSEPIIATLDD